MGETGIGSPPGGPGGFEVGRVAAMGVAPGPVAGNGIMDRGSRL